MSLANGREYLAIPGPSVMPDRVLRAMHRAAPNIYEGAIVDEVAGIAADLKRVAKTESNLAIYIANGHGAWEAAMANTHSRGDLCLVLATGRFALGWSMHAQGLGIELDVMDFGKSSDVDLEQVAERIAADTEHRIKSVIVVHVDTASSVRNDIPGIRRVLDEAGHPALFMVDCIASLACDDLPMDEWGVDLMVAACQQGLMTPPGLSFVFFNDKADRLRDSANCVTTYWDWRPRAWPQEFYQYFGGTAPTHHLFGLRAALDMIFEEGLEEVFTRHATLARAVWAAFDAWGTEGPLKMNIADPSKRSNAVTALSIGAPWGNDVRKWVEANAGVTLGLGIGMVDRSNPSSHGFFRIAHMGHVNTHMVLGALGSLEAALTALDIPHGTGALEAAAAVCAGR